MDKPLTFRSPIAVVIWVLWLLFAVGNWIDLAVQGRDHGSAVAAAILLLATGAVYVTGQRPQIIADDAGVTVRNPLRDHRVGWARVAKVDLAGLLRVHCDLGPAAAGPGGTEPPAKKQRKIISAWAVHYSRRRQLAAEVRARRVARFVGSRSSAPGLPPGGRGQPYATPAGETSAPEADAEMIARLLSQRATAARAEAVWAAGTAETAEAKAASGPAAAGTGAAGTGAAGTGATEAAAATGAGPAAGAGATEGATPAATAGWTQPLTSTWSGWAIAALVIPALILLAVWLL